MEAINFDGIKVAKQVNKTLFPTFNGTNQYVFRKRMLARALVI